MRYGTALLLVALTLLVSGCAPKRVTSTGVVDRPISRPARPARAVTNPPAPAPTSAVAFVDSLDLPPPEPIGRTGPHVVAGNRPASPRPTPAATALGPRAVALAKEQLGKPYQWGAAGPDKFDCSGLVQYVYSNLGVPLPRVSSQQASAGVHIDRADLQPGDLVFFVLSGSRIDHVGIYVGRGRFVHAPSRHRPVRTDSLNDSWWRRRYKGARRVG